MFIFKKTLTERVKRALRHLRECDLNEPCECHVSPNDTYYYPSEEVLELYANGEPPPMPMPYSILIEWVGSPEEEPSFMKEDVKEELLQALDVLHGFFPSFSDWMTNQKTVLAAMRVYSCKQFEKYNSGWSFITRGVCRTLRVFLRISNKKRIKIQYKPVGENLNSVHG